MNSRPNTSRVEADTIVIGAGPAGLGAALALGDSAIVLESRETVAGLCGTVTLDGAIFDLGGHSFSTPHPAIRCLVFAALKKVEKKGRRSPLPKEAVIAYPAKGGYGEIFQALARRVADLRFGQSVTSIDPRTSTLRTATGETAFWRRIISTLPLPVLLRLIPNVPAPISSAVSALEALPITLVMLVLDGPHETLRQRIYCPDKNIIGH